MSLIRRWCTGSEIHAAIHYWMSVMCPMEIWFNVVAVTQEFKEVSYNRDSQVCRGSVNRS